MSTPTERLEAAFERQRKLTERQGSNALAYLHGGLTVILGSDQFQQLKTASQVMDKLAECYEDAISFAERI